MTIFPNTNPARLAPGSFQQPIPIPAHSPSVPDLVTVCFNKDWLPVVLGCLIQSTLATTWQGSQDDVNLALQEANDLILIFQKALPGCQTKNPAFSGAVPKLMFRQDPDNPCLLQSSADGVNWCTWADISKCQVNAQPGNKSPQPASGQCQNFHGTIHMTDAWLLPVPVNTGDQITVRNLYGSWSPTAFTTIWDCPDGNLFFAGNCIDGTSSIDSGAPDPTAPLNGTVLFDGTNYYDVSAAAGVDVPVVVTIAPGVTNAQLIVRANFHGGVDPAGEAQFDIQICNNVPATWTHTFDFTMNNGGFVPQTGTGDIASGVWTPGTGWSSSDVTQPGPSTFRRIWLRKTFASANIDTWSVNFNLTKGTYGVPGSDFGLLLGEPTIADTAIISQVASAMVSGNGQVAPSMTAETAVTQFEIYLASSDAASGFDGACQINSITLTGHGPNPFGP